MSDKKQTEPETKQEIEIEDLEPADEESEQVKGGPQTMSFFPSIS